MELMTKRRIALLVGLLSVAVIAPLTAIAFNTPPTLSPLGSIIAIDIVAYHEAGNVEARHRPGILAPDVGSTLVIFNRDLRMRELELIKERQTNIVYDLGDLRVEKIMVVVTAKLLYWGDPSSWEPEGNVTIYVSGPSGEERYLDMQRISFPPSPSASTEIFTLTKLLVLMDRKLWAEGNGQYTLRFSANIDVTLDLQGGAVNRAVGKANAFVGVNVKEDKVILRTMSATQDSIIKTR